VISGNTNDHLAEIQFVIMALPASTEASDKTSSPPTLAVFSRLQHRFAGRPQDF
jgi:hypothetical protein